MGATIQTMQGHIVTGQGGGTFLIQGSTMDGEGTPLTHTTRASPATVSLPQRSYTGTPVSEFTFLTFYVCSSCCVIKYSHNHSQPTGN